MTGEDWHEAITLPNIDQFEPNLDRDLDQILVTFETHTNPTNRRNTCSASVLPVIFVRHGL
ncbi:hypothetical protein H6F88_28575 [Oculatella sp. FACHB-28]|uniref:hypothetical protein n=1 Tax=Oculatella sp. FACHB-28 TaxID=2692845 RepID=UPI001685D710|nr:hypothetical protein [Oculatella sp. FACHB-28]MBD2059898.1 hypothetical protein [Oculatella sp. FACHB-28]